jgi:hypothetical protein
MTDHAESHAVHADEDCWVPTFVRWAEGHTETLDFGGREVPERLQRLLTALEPDYHVLTLTEDQWNIQHPLECRPMLSSCPLNLSSGEADALYLANGPGRYRMEQHGPRFTNITRLGEGAGPEDKPENQSTSAKPMIQR